MYHGHDRRHHPCRFLDLALCIEAKVTHIRCSIALGLVAKADELAGVVVELRVCCEGHARQLAVKVLEPNRLKCLRIQSIRRRILFTSQQTPVEIEDICVGRAPNDKRDSVCVLVTVLS